MSTIIFCSLLVLGLVILCVIAYVISSHCYFSKTAESFKTCESKWQNVVSAWLHRRDIALIDVLEYQYDSTIVIYQPNKLNTQNSDVSDISTINQLSIKMIVYDSIETQYIFNCICAAHDINISTMQVQIQNQEQIKDPNTLYVSMIASRLARPGCEVESWTGVDAGREVMKFPRSRVFTCKAVDKAAFTFMMPLCYLSEIDAHEISGDWSIDAVTCVKVPLCLLSELHATAIRISSRLMYFSMYFTVNTIEGYQDAIEIEIDKPIAIDPIYMRGTIYKALRLQAADIPLQLKLDDKIVIRNQSPKWYNDHYRVTNVSDKAVEIASSIGLMWEPLGMKRIPITDTLFDTGKTMYYKNTNPIDNVLRLRDRVFFTDVATPALVSSVVSRGIYKFLIYDDQLNDANEYECADMPYIMREKECISERDIYGSIRTEGKGTWDKRCESHDECPFFSIKTGRGTCINGFCEMPIGVTRKGYTKYAGKPFCYNCPDRLKPTCCDSQKHPQYAFNNDVLQQKTIAEGDSWHNLLLQKK